MYDKINMEEALSQLGDSKKLYKTVVKGFHEKYEHVASEIRKLIDEGDLEEARRSAHSIKGLSGNLGASSLRAYALNLEKAIKNRDDDIYDCLDIFAEELDLVYDEVGLILKEVFSEEIEEESTIQDNKQITSPTLEIGDDIKAGFEKLIMALSTYKYSEVKMALQQIDDSEYAKVIRTRFEKAKKHIDNYDYDLAIDLLKEMMNS